MANVRLREWLKNKEHETPIRFKTMKDTSEKDLVEFVDQHFVHNKPKIDFLFNPREVLTYNGDQAIIWNTTIGPYKNVRHWTCVIHTPRACFYFDSLGFNHKQADPAVYLSQRACTTMIVSLTEGYQLQGGLGNTCGEWCIMFLTVLPRLGVKYERFSGPDSFMRFLKEQLGVRGVRRLHKKTTVLDNSPQLEYNDKQLIKTLNTNIV